MCWEDIAREPLVVQAQHNLSDFYMTVATERAHVLGIGWQPTPFAPNRYEDLRVEYVDAIRNRRPLMVSNLNSDSTVFVDDSVNEAVRFWHDTNHMRLGQDFSVNSELMIATYELDTLRKAGYRHNTIEYRLMRADTEGQALCVKELGRFPTNQLRFGMWALEAGLEEAIAYEASIEP